MNEKVPCTIWTPSAEESWVGLGGAYLAVHSLSARCGACHNLLTSVGVFPDNTGILRQLGYCFVCAKTAAVVATHIHQGSPTRIHTRRRRPSYGTENWMAYEPTHGMMSNNTPSSSTNLFSPDVGVFTQGIATTAVPACPCCISSGVSSPPLMQPWCHLDSVAHPDLVWGDYQSWVVFQCPIDPEHCWAVVV